jgi:signal transduction histidine kinase
MPIDSTTTRKSGINYSEKSDIPDALKAKTGEGTLEAASFTSDSQELLMRAQRNALEAKEAALGAMNRFYQEGKVSEKKAGKMLSELDEAIQLALNATKKSHGIDDKETGQDIGRSMVLPHNEKKLKKSKKILNAGHNPFGIVSDLKKSLSGKKPTDAEVEAEFYRLVMRQSPQLRQLIDDLTEDKARIKTEKILAEAKSEIIAARVAVNKAQEEINAAKEEAKKAFLGAENAQKPTDLIVSQVKQKAITEAANEITRAHEEVRAVKEAATAAIRQAQEENKKSRGEAAASNNHAQVTLTLAREKVKKDAEELKAYKLQAQIAVRQAQDEANKARAEAEAARREAQEAIQKAALESHQAKADRELAGQTRQEATVMAEKQAYDDFYEEIKKMRLEVQITNKTASEAMTRARGESQRAREELEMVKKASEAAINTARQETLEAQKAKQAMLEITSQAQDESRKVREGAEVSIIKANETIMQAKKDIINLTRDEIVRTRQELEATGKTVEYSEVRGGPPAGAAKLDSDYVATVLHEMRTPLHSISGFAKLMLEEDVSDDATRKEFLSIMVQQSESLNKLIDDLSHILYDKSEAFSIHKEPVSSYKIITEAIDSVQGMAQQKKNLISHNLTTSLPEVEADAFRIKQVIINLLTNAIKFSPENRPIFLKAGVRDEELLVQVIDYGIGIPKTELPAIFNRYYQAENRGDVEGTGLGLYICQQIIQAHGGRIWAESVEGEGSTFCFSSPIATARQ